MPGAETAIEVLPDFDHGLGPGEAVMASTELQVVLAQTNGVGLGHGARVTEAANPPGVDRRLERSPCRLWRRGWGQIRRA